MLILVLNRGSSSLKIGLYDAVSREWKVDKTIDHPADAEQAVQQTVQLLDAAGVAEVHAVGHRVVFAIGATRESALVGDALLMAIEQGASIAPLHNPPVLALIKAARQRWPDAPHVAVFDSYFHHSIPKHVSHYALPDDWQRAGVRRHGFHGLSHQSVAERVSLALATPASDLRIVSCHLGSGSSICAIKRGRSIETSMELSPLSGLMGATRSGNVDPGLFVYLNRSLGLDIEEITEALYKRSGLAALSGTDGDVRSILKAYDSGDARARLALNAFSHAVRHFIGAYAVAMGGLDVLAFTGGIGEHASLVRDLVARPLAWLGVAFDGVANANVDLATCGVSSIATPQSTVRVLVVACGEQMAIAEATLRRLSATARPPGAATGRSGLHEDFLIPVAVSARHVHLDEASVAALFGPGYQLHQRTALNQPGQWCATEVVQLVGPRGSIDNVHVLGPCRSHNQVEISQSDARAMGVDAPVRLSGVLDDTPKLVLRGPAGSIETRGVILAHRHIHTNPDGAHAMGVQAGDRVNVEVRTRDRSMVFEDVSIRVDRDFVTEMHLDTDEGNAAGIVRHAVGSLRVLSRSRPGSADALNARQGPSTHPIQPA